MSEGFDSADAAAGVRDTLVNLGLASSPLTLE